MITASPIARCSSFKFLTMQMWSSASRARNCGPFYPRPPCSQTSRIASTDELACSELANLCFDDLASGYRTHGWATRAAGYRAAISCNGTFETCRPALKMFVHQGRPEGRAHPENDANDPFRKSATQGYFIRAPPSLPTVEFRQPRCRILIPIGDGQCHASRKTENEYAPGDS